MLYPALIVAITALSNLASAQNYSTSGPLSVTPGQIPLPLRQNWCTAQLISCPEICGVIANPNTCDPETLMYQCVCSDGSKPNISDYQSTLPFFICEQWKANCVDSHPDQLGAITACQSVTCGQKNASALGEDGASGSSASASGSSPAASGSATATSQAMAAATHIAQHYGTQILAGGMLAAFGLAL